MLGIAFRNLLELREFEGFALNWGVDANPTANRVFYLPVGKVSLVRQKYLK
jgi:hypothetical protein